MSPVPVPTTYYRLVPVCLVNLQDHGITLILGPVLGCRQSRYVYMWQLNLRTISNFYGASLSKVELEANFLPPPLPLAGSGFSAALGLT